MKGCSGKDLRKRKDKDQCTRDTRSIDFNEDLNLWRELKLTRSPGRLFHSATTRSEKNFDRDVQLLNC